MPDFNALGQTVMSFTIWFNNHFLKILMDVIKNLYKSLREWELNMTVVSESADLISPVSDQNKMFLICKKLVSILHNPT